MKLHSRYFIVSKAQAEIESSVRDLVVKHELTFGEEMGILAGIMDRSAKYLVRMERHGRDDKKGDEE